METRSLICRSLAEVPATIREAVGEAVSVFVASTDAPDRMGDVLDQASWKLDNYKANPVVLADHDYSVDAVVGRGSVAVEGGRLVLGVTWDTEGRGADIGRKVKAGLINAVSVGFRPGPASGPRRVLPEGHPARHESGYWFVDCELLEVSVVAVPANPEAIVVGRGEARVSLDDLFRLGRRDQGAAHPPTDWADLWRR